MSNKYLAMIRPLCREHRIIWTHHAGKQMLSRGILKADVENVILHGKIIEKYPHDFPFPGCLLLGMSLEQEFLHVVCSVQVQAKMLNIVTAYYPSDDDWEDDYMTRRK